MAACHHLILLLLSLPKSGSIPVRMHTGERCGGCPDCSFNWTRSAHEINRENVLITTEPGAVHGYRDEFERLWTEFAGSDLSGR